MPTLLQPLQSPGVRVERKVERVLMCRPTAYDLFYEINPWMHLDSRPDKPLALQQWERLYRILRDDIGVAVELVPQAPGCPDMVFTANAGLVVPASVRDGAGRRMILSRFRHPQRQVEEPHFAAWFAAHGYTVETLDAGPFEGEGDALWVGDDLFAGYLKRSDIAAHRALAETLGCRVLSLELVDDRWYHLDTCFLPLGGGTVVYYPGAFDVYGCRVIEAHCRTIPIDEAEAHRFACNAVVAGNHVALPEGCPQLVRRLRDEGFIVHEIPMSEFLKCGGACKCLTLYLAWF